MTDRRMNFRGIRPSKFRHVYGLQAKKEKCYDQVTILLYTGIALAQFVTYGHIFFYNIGPS